MKRDCYKVPLSCVSGCRLSGSAIWDFYWNFHYLRLTLKIRQETTTQGSMNHSYRDSLKFCEENVPPACCHYGLLISITRLLSDVVCVSVVTHAAESMGALWTPTGTGESITLIRPCAMKLTWHVSVIPSHEDHHFQSQDPFLRQLQWTLPLSFIRCFLTSSTASDSTEIASLSPMKVPQTVSSILGNPRATDKLWRSPKWMGQPHYSICIRLQLNYDQ